MDEYNRFCQMAEQQHVKLRHLAKTKMLDSPVGLEEYMEHQARILPQLHSLIDQIPDEDLQDQLRRKVRELHAYL